MQSMPMLKFGGNRIFGVCGTRYMKVRELIKRLEADGWYLVDTEGSHRQYKHEKKPGRVTVPGHLRDDVNPKTLASIFRQAQLKR